MITSLGVIIAGVIMLTTGWYYADPLLSAAIGLFVLPRTWKLLREAIGVLLEGTPVEVDPVASRETADHRIAHLTLQIELPEWERAKTHL